MLLRFSACVVLVLAMSAGLPGPVSADVAMNGTFVASKECPAFQSFRKKTNPGDVKIEAGQTYPLIAGNAPQPTHYRLRIEGASPAERWVEAECGSVNGEGTAATAAPPAASASPAGSAKLQQPAVILALSWEPSFCATMQDKTECAAETPAGFDATHLVLHGLWPQPRGKQYCNVDRDVVDTDRRHDWKDLPAVVLEAPVRQHLDQVMPGTQSLLERHEWTRHGTCYYSEDANAYFSEAASLVDEVNGSAVQALFAAHAGQEISAADVRAAFDAAFGAGAGDRVRLSCTRDGPRRLLSEITIGLSGRVEGDKKLADLMLAAQGTRDAGCPSGLLVSVAPHS
jgi:ribonuclease T2